MNSTITRAALAITVLASPLAAQVNVRHDHGRSRSTTTSSTGDVGSILNRSDRSDTRAQRIPPGQLPPRGMCRLWIDNVPPGRQPPVTDCATAEAQRLQTPNSRVIYGDENSFRGRGKGKFKHARNSESTRGSVLDRRSRGDDDDENEIENDRDDRGQVGDADQDDVRERSEGRGHHKNGKGRGD